MMRKSVNRFVAFVCSSAMMAWAAYAEELAPDEAPPLLVSADDIAAALDGARCLLSSGDEQAAKTALEEVYDSAAGVGRPGQAIAAEAASCLAIVADRAGRPFEAWKWFGRAAKAAELSSMAGLPHALRLAEAAVAPDGNGYETAMRLAFLSLPTLVTALAVDPRQPESPDHSMSLKALKALVLPDREKFTADPTLDNKIKLLTSLILFGEIASRPEEQLFAEANSAFQEGLALLAEVEQELRDDPEKDRRLSEDRPLAVRFDVIRFRQAKVRDKNNQSLKADRERTKKLQALVLSYRDMAGAFASAMSAHLGGDESGALSHIDHAIEKTTEIRGVIEAERDYYLLAAEPAALAGSDPDTEIAYNRVSSFTPRLSSESLVLRGLSRFRMPQPAAEGDAGERISGSLHDVVKGLADDAAGDPANALGHYAAGIMHEARGDLLLEPDPTDKAARVQAMEEFKKARDSLVKAAEGAKGTLSKEISGRLAILNGFQAAIDRARERAEKGDLIVASQILAAGIRRHDDVQLWARWATTAARAGEDKHSIRKVLEKAAATGIIDADSAGFGLALGRAVIDDVMAQTSSVLEKLDEKTREDAVAQLTAAITQLRAASGSLDGSNKAICGAFESLAVAYRGILSEQTAKAVETDFADAYALCKTSHEALTRGLKANNGGNHLDLQEALVACRLALGYLATATVPDFQDDAIAAFSGAFDEQSRLPGNRTALKIAGAPLVSALRDRPLDAGKESVNYEQRLRRSMVSLLDGAVSLGFGIPEDSSRFLEEGLKRLRSRAVDADVQPDAASLFNDSDTFEVERYLEDFMSVLAVLADVESGRASDSLLKAIRRVDPDALKGKEDTPLQEALTTELLQRVLSRTKSPMALYAVGRAVEAYALSLELSEDANAAVRRLLAVGRTAIADARKATTPWLASRYPAFVQLVGQSEQRLAGPETFLAQVRQLRGQGRLDDAVTELKKAVKLYRENRELWRLWVEVGLAKAVEAAGTASDKDDALGGLSNVIANGRANGAFSAADELYFNAVVDDRLGNIDPAIDKYLRAVRDKDLDQLYRVRAKARLAVLRLGASRAEDVAQVSGSK